MQGPSHPLDAHLAAGHASGGSSFFCRGPCWRTPSCVCSARHEVSIAYSDDPASADLSDSQRAALGAMIDKQPLWTFTLHPREAQIGVQVFSFVHDGEAFRYLGKLASI